VNDFEYDQKEPGAAVFDTSALQARLEAIERNEERVERSLREELGIHRD
jgi:hypothetical protein